MVKQMLHEGDFLVLSLCREDILGEGYHVPFDLDDADMTYIASKVGSILTEHDFWDALETVVNDLVHVRQQRGD